MSVAEWSQIVDAAAAVPLRIVPPPPPTRRPSRPPSAVTHNCQGCGVVFTGHPNARYCGGDCKHASKGSQLVPAMDAPELLPWRASAACLGEWEMFLTDDHMDEARKVCGACPVKAPCLAEALERDEIGVRGGLTSNERARMQRRARRRTA